MAVKQQIQVQAAILQKDEQDLLEAVRDLGQSQQQQGIVDIVKRIFDPPGITGQADTGAVSAAQGMLDYAKETRDRADRERARLFAQLEVAMSALQAAVDKLSAANSAPITTRWPRSTASAFTSKTTFSTTCRRSGATSLPISASSACTTSTFRSSCRGTRRRTPRSRRMWTWLEGLGRAPRADDRDVEDPDTEVDVEMEEARGGSRPRHGARLRGQLHDLRTQGEQPRHAPHDAGLPRRRRGAAAARPRRDAGTTRSRNSSTSPSACTTPTRTSTRTAGKS